MWTCALVSSAMRPALSPPHVPARSLGGRTAVGSHGPKSVVAAMSATTVRVIMDSPYQIYPLPPSLGHIRALCATLDRDHGVTAIDTPISSLRFGCTNPSFGAGSVMALTLQ